jgi:hypothetical protein
MMIARSETFRDLARHAGEKARQAHSDDEGAMQRKRQTALNQLAENEDWLAGVHPATDVAISGRSSG